MGAESNRVSESFQKAAKSKRQWLGQQEFIARHMQFRPEIGRSRPETKGLPVECPAGVLD